MKVRFIVSIPAFFFVFLAGLIISNSGIASENRGQEKMVLNGGAMGSVDFEHKKHQGRIPDCQVCHKDFKPEKGALDAAKAAGSLKKKQVMNKTCIACHRSMAKEGKVGGPVSCRDCHKK